MTSGSIASTSSNYSHFLIESTRPCMRSVSWVKIAPGTALVGSSESQTSSSAVTVALGKNGRLEGLSFEDLWPSGTKPSVAERPRRGTGPATRGEVAVSREDFGEWVAEFSVTTSPPYIEAWVGRLYELCLDTAWSRRLEGLAKELGLAVGTLSFVMTSLGVFGTGLERAFESPRTPVGNGVDWVNGLERVRRPSCGRGVKSPRPRVGIVLRSACL